MSADHLIGLYLADTGIITLSSRIDAQDGNLHIVRVYQTRDYD